MTTVAAVTTAIALATTLTLALTACVGGTSPSPPRPSTSSVPAEPSPSPSEPAAFDPIVDPAVEVEPDPDAEVETPARAEVTRADAYDICLRESLAYSAAAPDPRNTYSGFDGSYVEAVDGWWRVWIPGVEHPDDTPVSIAQVCLINGFLDDPTIGAVGGVATDFYPDRDAYFEELTHQDPGHGH